jgi:hypothetical protein
MKLEGGRLAADGGGKNIRDARGKGVVPSPSHHHDGIMGTDKPGKRVFVHVDC